MEKLYIETDSGNLPIDPGVAERLKLEKGTFSPFTNRRIIGERGDFPKETPAEKGPKNSEAALKLNEEGFEPTENIQFSTAEILDLARGVDSSTEE
jgi:hypothetical protein